MVRRVVRAGWSELSALINVLAINAFGLSIEGGSLMAIDHFGFGRGTR